MIIKKIIARVDRKSIDKFLTDVVHLKFLENKISSPNINNIFEILLPIIVPITKESALSENKTPEIAVNNSGRDVPIATIVKPITNFDNPILCPRIEDVLNK